MLVRSWRAGPGDMGCRTPSGHPFIAATSNEWQSHRIAKDLRGGLRHSPLTREGKQNVDKTMGCGVQLPAFSLCALNQVA